MTQFVVLLAAALLLGLSHGPAHAQAERLILVDDLAGPDFSNSGGLFYKKNFEQSAGTVRFASSEIRDGRGVLELTIRPNCTVSGTECSERAEIWEKNDVLVPYDKGVWYAFSMKLAEPIPNDAGRHMMAQWKRQIPDGADGDFSPFLALRLRHGALYVTVETEALQALANPDGSPKTNCGPGETLVSTRAADKQSRAVVAIEPGAARPQEGGVLACTNEIKVIEHGPLPSARSGWIDLVFYSRPGPGGDGHVEIIANGRKIASITGRIGHNLLSKHQYFKFGPYREPRGEPWTVYFDRFRRGPNCEDVAIIGCG